MNEKNDPEQVDLQCCVFPTNVRCPFDAVLA